MLSIEQILALDDLKIEEVSVPEWGGTVFVRSLTALERVAMGKALDQAIKAGVDRSTAGISASLSAFLCDAERNPVTTFDQAQQLAAKNGVAVERIVAAGQRLNAMGPEVETLAKN